MLIPPLPLASWLVMTKKARSTQLKLQVERDQLILMIFAQGRVVYQIIMIVALKLSLIKLLNIMLLSQKTYQVLFQLYLMVMRTIILMFQADVLQLLSAL